MVTSGPRMAPPTVAPAASGVATSFTADSRSALAEPSHERFGQTAKRLSAESRF